MDAFTPYTVVHATQSKYISIFELISHAFKILCTQVETHLKRQKYMGLVHSQSSEQ